MKIMNPIITSQESVVGSNGKGDLTELDQLFKPGDYVSISTPRGILAGRVVAMRSKSIELKSAGGRIIIPYSLIYSADIINHSAGKKYFREGIKPLHQDEKNT